MSHRSLGVVAFLFSALAHAASFDGGFHDSGIRDAGKPVIVYKKADGGLWDGGYDAKIPPSWTLKEKFPNGSPLIDALIAELSKDGGHLDKGESRLSFEEASKLFSDERAQLVYGEKTVSIVAPSMVSKHRQEHIDLMKLFLKPERVQAGLEFAKEKKDIFDATEKKTGVHREVIIGILMWESKLGTITGDYRAFNSFTSQYLFIDDANAVALSRKEEKLLLDVEGQKKRVERIRDRARGNLLALVRQCKNKEIDVFSMKGSWAGALGFPQFMPASLRWADDGNADGQIDLFNMDDAIASVGKYLKAHGYADSARESVYGYNHENAYVDGVLAFGEAVKIKLRPDAGIVFPLAGPKAFDAGAVDAGR
jgi:membrane-bound lytic murein transglycosylase B